MKYDRRAFLKNAMAGMAATGVTGISVLSLPSRAELVAPASSISKRDIVESSDEERKQLITEAHFGRKRGASSEKGMVITSHPLATREAVRILKKGGNACDAALCAAITQTVVEPHMTGITGILSMLYYDATSGKTTYLNGNMNTPLKPLPGFSPSDLSTGRGVAVPGFWAGFEAALERHGSKPKRELMAAAIRYAREGFEIHPFLWGQMFAQCHRVGLTPEGREIFMPDKVLPRPGDMLYQRKAANTLERLAEEGNDFFYRGEFAEEFCKIVQEAGGVITRKDLEAYEVRWQEPAWGTYRGHEIAASPPPDNGGTHIIEALNMIELLDLKRLGPPTESAETLNQMVRILATVFVEGGRQNDPKSHSLPLDVILSKEYAQMRFKLLQMAVPKTEQLPESGSNHVTVMDGNGNIATIIHSCMSTAWSNGLFVKGVSIVAAGAHFLRIMPKPGYRATTYVAPNILFKNKKPILASGSPSVGLLANIIQNTVNILDFNLPIGESVERPRFGAAGQSSQASCQIEADFNEQVRRKAEEKGLRFEVVNPWNWHHGSFEGIYIHPSSGIMMACGDPRRCSKAEGV